MDMIVDVIRRSSLNLAGGAIRTRGEEIRVRTIGRKYTGEALSSIVVLARPEGEIITLDRVAVINDGFMVSLFGLIMVCGPYRRGGQRRHCNFYDFYK